jgi:hypothetical protein
MADTSDPAAVESNIRRASPLPAPELLDAKPEQHMTLDHERFKRLRNLVDELAVYERPWSAVGWAAVSLGGAAILTLIVWLPTYRSLDSAGQRATTWVALALVATIVVAVISSLLSLAMTLSNRKELRRNSQHIVSEMDEIYKRWQEAEVRRRATESARVPSGDAPPSSPSR